MGSSFAGLALYVTVGITGKGKDGRSDGVSRL